LEIVENSKKYDCKLITPVDFVTLDGRIVSSVIGNEEFLDIGPNSVELFNKHMRESRTLLWNGPVGLFEKTPFDFGTKSIAKEAAKLTREKKLFSVAGGGDSVFAMNKFETAQDFSYVSTAGGAFLSYLEGSEFPGIANMTSFDIAPTNIRLSLK
jgi:phosphoglycerate kinase